MVRRDWPDGGSCRSSFDADGEPEGSGCSGQIDTEVPASEHSSAPTRKFLNMNVDNHDTFNVPIQVFSPSYLSSSEKKGLIHRFKLELDQIRKVQKKFVSQAPKVASLSTGNDIVSCKNRKDGPCDSNFRKTSAMSSMHGKKMHPSKPAQLNKATFDAEKLVPGPSSAHMILMKQCETLLKRLMSHQHGWIFNTPVDVVQLNIPDYLTIIKQPMDLGTIKKKLMSGVYSSPLEFLADVRLTFKNAMDYNPIGHDVHIMADALSKYFEVRWKTIERKLPKTGSPKSPVEFGPDGKMETTNIQPIKRKTSPHQQQIEAEPVKRVMLNEEKVKLCRDLESLIGEMPPHVIDFLRIHCSSGGDAGEDEIEIDINGLADDTMFTLRKLLDDYLDEKKKKNQESVEPCDIELLNESAPSNSSYQLLKGNEVDDEEVDIGGNELPMTSFASVEIEKAMTSHEQVKGTCLKDELSAHASNPMNSPKAGLLHGETRTSNPPEKSGANSNLQEQIPQRIHNDLLVESKRDGNNSALSQKHVSPGKRYREAFLKDRFADIILKAREKKLLPNQAWNNDDPEKLQQERELLEMRKNEEKARLQAEVRAAEAARRQAEEVAAQDAREKRELERQAARQALLKIEKTVEINENTLVLEQLEMFMSGPPEHILSPADEASPDLIQDGLNLDCPNPLEKLGLFMKEEDEEEEECDPFDVLKPDTDVEEGEID